MILLFFSTQNSSGAHIVFHSMDTYGPLPGDKADGEQSVNLTTHLHVLLKLRMSEATPQLSHVPQHSAQIQLYLYIYFHTTMKWMVLVNP
jgi:hypothetical protein